MNPRAIDTLTRLLGHAPSRRVMLPVLGGLLTTPLLGFVPAAARKKKKGKKSTLCLDGQTVQASKKKKKKLLKSGATAGACPAPPPGCTPTCAGNVCGGDDGCGGMCGCAAGSICHEGVCHACDVTCTGDGVACGNQLKAFLMGGGTVYACPGRYVGNFEVGNGALIGAGQGADPATSTILDANGSGHVVFIKPTIITALHGLRITGGNLPDVGGGGIANVGSLTVTACTIDQNRADLGGGGIAHVGTKLTLNACTVSHNTSSLGTGGGIYAATGSLMVVTGTAITGNTAAAGGGIYSADKKDMDDVTLNGATVSDNSAPECVNVAGC